MPPGVGEGGGGVERVGEKEVEVAWQLVTCRALFLSMWMIRRR